MKLAKVVFLEKVVYLVQNFVSKIVPSYGRVRTALGKKSADFTKGRQNFRAQNFVVVFLEKLLLLALVKLLLFREFFLAP